MRNLRGKVSNTLAGKETRCQVSELPSSDVLSAPAFAQNWFQVLGWEQDLKVEDTLDTATQVK